MKLPLNECVYEATSVAAGNVKVFFNRGKAPTYTVEQLGVEIKVVPATTGWRREQRETIIWAEKLLGFTPVTGQPNCGPTYEAEMELKYQAQAAKYKGSVINP